MVRYTEGVTEGVTDGVNEGVNEGVTEGLTDGVNDGISKPGAPRPAPSLLERAAALGGATQVTPFLAAERGVGLSLAPALSDRECQRLLARLSAQGFAPTGGSYPATYRNNDRMVFDDAELAAALHERLGAALPSTIVHDGERWTRCGLNARFRACRYQHGQAFCVHRDGPHLRDLHTRSFLTLQFYLDDAAQMTGGRTRFYADREAKALWAEMTPRRGTAIVFDHGVWHDGEAVTAGQKHVLRTDVMYQRQAPTVVTVAPTEATEAAAATAAAAVPREGQHRGYVFCVIGLADQRGHRASGHLMNH